MKHASVCRILLASFASLCMSGCVSSFVSRPVLAPQRFTLDGGTAPDSSPREPRRSAGVTLMVDAPRASAAYDTTQIVYVQRAQEIEYFATHQWIDTPPNMLAPLLVRAIDRTMAFTAVVTASSTASAQMRLDTEVVRLEQDFSHSPSTVRLTMHAVLVDAKTRAVMADRTFDVVVPSVGDDPYSGVLAARQASEQVLGQIAAFCASNARP